MSNRVDTSLLSELKEYGAVNVESCFNCGNCTAICPLTEDNHLFPRNTIRLIQMGMTDRLMSSTDPWLCYYCGDCSATCPREAEPAETMMAARRWLTAKYDRSGHGAKLYTSEKALWRAVLMYALVPVVLLLIFHGLTALGLQGFGRIVTDRVELNAFAPALWVWAVVLIDFLILGSRLLRSILTPNPLRHLSPRTENPRSAWIHAEALAGMWGRSQPMVQTPDLDFRIWSHAGVDCWHALVVPNG